MKKRLAAFTFLLFILTLILVKHTQAQDPLDSLTICHDTQKLMFENSYVRVIDDVIQPGVSESKHHHPHGLVIALEDSDMETRSYPDGQPSRRHAVKGTATWNESLVHDVRNVGTQTSHFIRIDIKGL